MSTSRRPKPSPERTPIAVRRLRWQLYNATLVSARRVHEDLAVFRVRGDGGNPPIRPGQYTLLGVGSWEARVDGLPAPPGSAGRRAQLIRRAYSVSSPLLRDGRVVHLGDLPWLEFYVALVRRPDGDRPSLTPRLFTLRPGDRLFLGPHAKGRYTLDPVRPDEDVIFCATGTGEGPHNAMIGELLAGGHRGRIVSAVTVRLRRDLGYVEAHRELERRYAGYRYVVLTTREPENLDPEHPGYVGRRHLQDLFAEKERCRETLGFVPRPGTARFFLCGNPAMIGLPRRGDDGRPVFPKPRGMAEVLAGLGYRLEEPGIVGDVHFERYW